MKHLAKIQIEFLKQAADWDQMSYEVQKQYLKLHPKSKKKITAKPKPEGEDVSKLEESITEKKDQINQSLVTDALLEDIRHDRIHHIEAYNSPEELLRPISAIIAGHGDGIDQTYLDKLDDDEWEEGLENEFFESIDEVMSKNGIDEPVVAFTKKLVKSEAWRNKLQKLLDTAEEEMP